MQPRRIDARTDGKAGRGVGVVDLAAPLYTDMHRHTPSNASTHMDLCVTAESNASRKDCSAQLLFDSSTSMSTDDRDDTARRARASAASPTPTHVELSHHHPTPLTGQHEHKTRVTPSHLLPYRYLVRPGNTHAPMRLPLPRRARSNRTCAKDASGTHASVIVDSSTIDGSKTSNNRRDKNVNNDTKMKVKKSTTAHPPSSSSAPPPSQTRARHRPHLAAVECCMGAEPRHASRSALSNSSSVGVTLPYARWVRRDEVSPGRLGHWWTAAEEEQERCAGVPCDAPHRHRDDEALYVRACLNWSAPIDAAAHFDQVRNGADISGTVQSGCDDFVRASHAHVVRIHVYDLHSGLMAQHSKALLGVHVPGLYHSSVVCYGLEFYFEGGVAVAAPGRTRFGTRFARYTVGETTHELPDFLAWLRAREAGSYDRASYHVTTHNCHHFTRDAVAWLVRPLPGSESNHSSRTNSSARDGTPYCESHDNNTHANTSGDCHSDDGSHDGNETSGASEHSDSDVVPRFLFDTVQTVVENEVGGAVLAAVWHCMQGYQYLAARQQLSRVTYRQSAAAMLEQAALYAGVNCTPPSMIVAFRTPRRGQRGRISRAAHPTAPRWGDEEVHQMMSHSTGGDTRVARMALQELLEELVGPDCDEHGSTCTGSGCTHHASGPRCIYSPPWAQQWVRCLIQLLLRQPQHQWAALLRLLRQGLLHRVLATLSAFEPTLLSALLLAARDFARLPPSVRLELLRVLCQWGSAAGVGQAIYTAPAYVASWVAVAGMGLRDLDCGIRYTAACLAVNLSVALGLALADEKAGAACVGGGGRREAARSGRTAERSGVVRHGLRQLITVLLFSLRSHVAVERVTAEGVLHMMMLALVHAASSGSAMVSFVIRHRFRLPYYELLSRARSNESRALLCILHALEDMHQTA